MNSLRLCWALAALVPLSLAALWWWTGPIQKLDRRAG